jgi:NADPH:quinone reductase-like Zn-dependent oxidoreductase
MKTIILTEFGGAENFRLIEQPKFAPKIGEVLVAIKSVSFNPVDVYQRIGKLGGKLPLILGRDMSGVIEEVGKDVIEFAKGDEVYGRISTGTYAEFTTVAEEFLSRKPSNLSFSQAAAIPVAGMTAYESVFVKARVNRGQSALVAGASGGVGSMAVQMLRHLETDPLIVTAGSERSARYLTDYLQINPEHVLLYQGLSINELTQKIKKMCTGRGVDAAFDFVGGEMKRLCFECARVNGEVVSIVEEPADFVLNLWDENTSPLVLKSLSFHFVQLGARAVYGTKDDWKFYRKTLDELRNLLETGIISPPVIQEVGNLSVETIRQAHGLLETGQTWGKLVMTVNNDVD